jgi:hypothetical protein
VKAASTPLAQALRQSCQIAIEPLFNLIALCRQLLSRLKNSVGRLILKPFGEIENPVVCRSRMVALINNAE